MNNIDLERQLQSIAGGMEYPPTPDIAGSVAARLRPSPRPRFMNRTLARSLVLAAILLSSLLLIPPVRAAVLEFIQIGVVRIFRSEPAPTPAGMPSTPVPLTPTAAATLQSLPALLGQMAGETTLAEVQQNVDYPILLPTYPAGIGEPDLVYVQDANGPMTIMVWMDPQQPGQVKMSLHFIPETSWAVTKFDPVAVDETSVNGGRAIWAVGPYPIYLENGELKISRLVGGHVLIWEENGVTYRLETLLSMGEAVRIAESLKPVP